MFTSTVYLCFNFVPFRPTVTLAGPVTLFIFHPAFSFFCLMSVTFGSKTFAVLDFGLEGFPVVDSCSLYPPFLPGPVSSPDASAIAVWLVNLRAFILHDVSKNPLVHPCEIFSVLKFNLGYSRAQYRPQNLFLR